MERTTLSELDLPANQSRNRLFLQTELKNEGTEGFTLTVLDGENVWEGSISEDDLYQLSEKLKMDFNTYVKETIAAFTKEDAKDLNFECSFTKSSNTAQLQWKKIPTDDIKYNLGSVNLKKCANPAAKIVSTLSQCISVTQELRSRIESLETANEMLALERQQALKRLDKCVTAKEELEKDLYAKFVLVLNSKKERIRALLEGRDDGDSPDASYAPVAGTSRDGENPPAASRGSADRNGQAAKHKSYQSEDDFCVNTDEDSPPPSKKQPRTNSKQKPRSLESSLNLGEDEEDEQTKPGPAARRPRRQAVNKKQTPAKPILPRVSSGDTPTAERPGSVGKRSSLRKGGSNNSNKSSDNVDPDDLLENF